MKRHERGPGGKPKNRFAGQNRGGPRRHDRPRPPAAAGAASLETEPLAAESFPPPDPSLPSLPRVELRPHEDRRIRRGHLWIFSNEVQAAPPELSAGDRVHFYSSRNEFLGVGFYNPHSLIAGRLLERHAAELDQAFFETRLRRAKEMRETFYADPAYRWVFGESDDLPGLVIDRYGDALVVESYAAGVDKLMPSILGALRAIQPWKAIVLRNDSEVRRLEHVELSVRVEDGAVETPHWFEMDGLKYAADLQQGQKTGFFFDQRENRKAAALLAKGRRVADVFSHTGGFGLLCAQAGAKDVVCVDNSEPALALATSIAEANGLQDRMRFDKSEAFQWLQNTTEKFGLLVLDPPRFAHSKKQLPAAVQAYIKLNVLGLKRVAAGGFLATASCSQHVDREEFRQILSRAAYEAGRRVRLVQWGGQAKDHPVRLSMPETEYLKFAILQVT